MTTLNPAPASTTSADGEPLVSYNPATGEPVGEVPVTPADAVPDAIARARGAQPGWAALTCEQRAAFLSEAGRRLVEKADEIGELLTREMGKPLPEAIGEVKHCGESMDETLAEIAAALQPTPLESEGVSSTIYRDPFGVCAGITPWNFPVSMPHWTCIPALMAGNTVVLKPSEETPLVAQAYADVLNEFLPKDVLVVVHGRDATGKAVVAGDVDLISFTGSGEAGKHILSAASADLKRVILELGGKDPLIVLDDADVEEAAAFAARNSFRNAGQVCVSTERIYVAASIADEFEAKVVEQARAMKQGDGMEADVAVGPMISERQRDHVLDQLDQAIRDGARVLFGGDGHHGNFVTPTVLGNVTHDMNIMRDETFGPVACIQRFKDDDEAIRLANDTPYGLGAAVFGGDVDRAASVGRRLTAGMIGINKSCGGASGSPWVGAQQSGYGYHSGPEGHRQFTQPRVVSVAR